MNNWGKFGNCHRTLLVWLLSFFIVAVCQASQDNDLVDDSNIVTQGDLFRLNGLRATRKLHSTSVLDFRISRVTIRKLPMSRVFIEFSKLEGKLPQIGSFSEVSSEEDILPTTKSANMYVVHTRVANNPLINYQEHNKTLRQVFDAICVQAGWSYYEDNQGVHFIDNSDYFVTSEQLSKGGNYISIDANSSTPSSRVLDLTVKRIVVTQLPMEEILKKLATAIMIDRVHHPIMYKCYYPTSHEEKTRLVSITASDVSLRDLFNQLCKQSGWSYRHDQYSITFSNGSAQVKG